MAEPSSDLEQRLDALRTVFATKLMERVEDLETMADAMIRDDSKGEPDTAIRAVRDHAHKLVGSGATFGFPAVSEVSRELETLCDSLIDAKTSPSRGQWEQIARLIQTLRAISESGAQGKSPAD
jgi:HPt (histidine-containing phosphotransfer) domain-containing protein